MNGSRRKSVICERIVTNHQLRHRKISSLRESNAKARRVSLPFVSLDYGSGNSPGISTEKEYHSKRTFSGTVVAATKSVSATNCEFVDKDESDYLCREQYDVAKRRILLEIQNIEKQEVEDVFQHGGDTREYDEEGEEEEKEKINQKEKMKKQIGHEEYALTRFFKWMSKEHYIILEFSLYMPLLMMVLYLVLIEGTPLYRYVEKQDKHNISWTSFTMDYWRGYIVEFKRLSLKLLYYFEDRNVNIRLT